MEARSLTRIQLPFQTAGAAHNLKNSSFHERLDDPSAPRPAQRQALAHANGVSRVSAGHRLQGRAQRGDQAAAGTDVSVAVRGLLLKDSQLKALTLKGQRPALTAAAAAAAAVDSLRRRQPS